MNKTPNYSNVLLKLSGEALLGQQQSGIDPFVIDRIANEVAHVAQMGVKISLVIGGGNIFRGVEGEAQGIERVTSDYMGMLATMMNALALQSAFEKKGLHTRVQSALTIHNICEPFVQRRAKHHLEKGRIVIFSAGIGHPYFTTDSAAVLRANEMGCDLLLKGTKVDGIYTSDPIKDSTAKRYDKISYADVLSKQLNVMDMTAIALARDTCLPIAIFSINQPNSFIDIIVGKGHYSLVHSTQ